MVYGSWDISLELTLVDNNGIKLKEETGPPFLHQLSYSLLCFLKRSGSFPGSLLHLPLIGIEFIPSNHPLNLPGGDPFGIFLFIDDLQLLLAIVETSPPQAPYPLFLNEAHFPVPLTMGGSGPVSHARNIVP